MRPPRSLHLLGLLSCLSLAGACTVDEDDPGPGGPDGSAGTTGGSGATCGAGLDRTTGAGGATGTAGTGGAGLAGAPPTSPYIVVDQFGYLPDGEKVAVIRDPQTGFDASESFTPGASYALVDAATGTPVLTAAPVAWNGGATDVSSGDRAWWFTFTSVTTPGDYYVLDVDLNVRSYAFRIADDVYADVLRQAVRMFFYQRAGQAKDAAYAGAGWADCASHVGPLQDHQCRLFSDKNNAATERDVWGGWYDAGDLNKYTSWTAGYVENLLRAYAENPAIWTDDYGIPESGNGIPDVLDEALWGLDYLTRLQGPDGSMLSIVGEAAASPPSSATRQSLYGPATTAATLAGAAAFAVASRVLRLPGDAALTAAADDCLARAEQAWSWAVANPSVQFRNNSAASGSSGLGSGQQEPNDYGRLAYKLDAAAQLFAATGGATYQAFFDASYRQLHLFTSNDYVSPWDVAGQDAALDYAAAAGATAAVAQAIRDAYLAGARSSGNLGAITNDQDPYLAYMKDYVWGSNSTKSNTGNLFAAVVTHELDAASNADMMRAASRYLHYLHGTNPLSLVYLTNMYQHGAENCANELYHSWFADGSALWDRVGVSTFGPPPGFLTGGPNPSYNWDACCPSSCSGAGNNALCGTAALSPPRGQPQQKAYKDFNDGWPLDSWSVTEPSNGYQVAYIRLLSKFVR